MFSVIFEVLLYGPAARYSADALYLASDDSGFMVGQVISPNGGWTTA